MASAEVQIDSSGTSSPLARRRAARSRARVDRVVGEHQERQPALAQRARGSGRRPGSRAPRATSTPSMSISQERISRRVTACSSRGSPSGRIAGPSAPTGGRWRQTPAAADHHRMINLGIESRIPGPIDGRLGDPDPLRRAERLRDARPRDRAQRRRSPTRWSTSTTGPSATAAPGAGPRSSRTSTRTCARRPEGLTGLFPGAGRGWPGGRQRGGHEEQPSSSPSSPPS